MNLPGHASGASRQREWGRRLVQGFILGALLGLAIGQLNLDALVGGLEDDLLIPGMIGAAINVTRGGRLLWWGAGLALSMLLIVSFTPLVAYLVRPLAQADAVTDEPIVILGSDVPAGGDGISSSGQQRALWAFSRLVAGRGDGAVIVLTRPAEGGERWVESVRRQMESLSIRASTYVVGPVTNTHDEAVAVRKLSVERGWDRVTLVTDPIHMKRATATFEKAGLRVTRSPCMERRFDLTTLGTPGDRLKAFRSWFHEAVGYRVYRARGWI
jgi:uncharacterized SAM-binding protein YcdF (DUF218 family)